MSLSTDGGVTWREGHIGGSFDMRTAPFRGEAESDLVAEAFDAAFGFGIKGRFVGDYDQLIALPDGRFGVVFAQAKPQATVGATGIFFARLRKNAN